MQKVFSNPLLEVACFNIESCLLAQKSGADRIEFCADYSVGGVTPNRDDILKARSLLHIPLHVIIRPRGGNFTYTTSEIELIKEDILFCKQHEIDGVVFGVLTEDRKIDKKINQELILLSSHMSTTFHRAIDECENIEGAMTDLILLGFKRVLTSGGKQNAQEGIEQLKFLQAKFGKEIIIIPGGGIRSSNIEHIVKHTSCYEFHTAAIINNFINVNEIKKMNYPGAEPRGNSFWLVSTILF